MNILRFLTSTANPEANIDVQTSKLTRSIDPFGSLCAGGDDDHFHFPHSTQSKVTDIVDPVVVNLFVELISPHFRHPLDRK